MHTRSMDLSQMFLRIAVSTAFLSAVADRMGLWGMPGSPDVFWGNWENFVAYSNSLNFFVSPQIGEFLAIAATVLEVVFGILLIAGYKTRFAAFASGLLLTLFALAMTLSLGIKSTFSYSVWIGASACFLLACIPIYRFSLDQLLNKAR